MNTNSNNKIAVLGATGKVGSQVLFFLSKAGIPARALTRNLAKAKEMPQVEWIEGDMNDEVVIRKLMEGCNRLFLNSGVHQDMVALQCRIIDIAKETGITYIIKLSTPQAHPESKDAMGGWHWQIEEHLKESGLSWNILQPQSFMQNWLGDFATTVKAERKIYEASGDGKRAFTDTRDIGEVAATLFADAGTWANSIIPLSGPELVSFYDVATAIAQAIGETVIYIDQTPDEARVRMQQKGMPEWLINTFLTIANNQKTGVVERLVTPNASLILGKPSRSAADFATGYAAFFK